VGGTCVPLEPASTTDASASSGGTSQCGEQLLVQVDTMALAGTEVLEGYPLLVSLTEPALVGIVGELWWSDTSGDVLPFELETRDGSTGTLRAWVRLPAWTPGEALDLVLHLGDPDPPPPADPASVWPVGFLGVWHLDDPLTGGASDPQFDSTGNGQHGVAVGDMTEDQVVDGQIGPGIAFGGDDDAIEFVDATFRGTLDSSTISIWARVDADGSVENPFFSRVNGDVLYPRCRTRPDEDGAVQCQTKVDDIPLALRAPAKLVPRGQWHHVAITFDAASGRFALYTNGDLIVDAMLATLPQAGGEAIPQLGRIEEFGSLLGVLDEFRVVDHPLSAAWIAADERSQREPGAIARVIGSAEAAACP
jgi:hypothetical protein